MDRSKCRVGRASRGPELNLPSHARISTLAMRDLLTSLFPIRAITFWRLISLFICQAGRGLSPRGEKGLMIMSE